MLKPGFLGGGGEADFAERWLKNANRRETRWLFRGKETDLLLFRKKRRVFINVDCLGPTKKKGKKKVRLRRGKASVLR